MSTPSDAVEVTTVPEITEMTTPPHPICEPDPVPRWTGARAAAIGIIAAVATLLLFGEVGSLVSAPHMRALRHGGKVYGSLNPGPKVTDPGYEIGSYLLLLRLIWWLAASVWVGVIVRRGLDLYRVILPAIIELMFLLILFLLLPQLRSIGDG